MDEAVCPLRLQHGDRIEKERLWKENKRRNLAGFRHDQAVILHGVSNSHQRRVTAKAIKSELTRLGIQPRADSEAENTPKKPSNHSLMKQRSFVTSLNLLRSMGVGSFLLGSSGLLQTHFWFGVSLISAGSLFFICDFLFEPALKGRYLPKAVVISLISLAYWWFLKEGVLINAPLVRYVALESTSRPPSSTSGIKWQPGLLPVAISFTNETARDYHDIEIRVLPDVPIVQIAELSHLQCLFIGGNSNPMIVGPGYISTIPKEIGGYQGKTYEFQYMATAGGYRIRCATLPRKSSLDLMLAVGQPNDPFSHDNPGGILEGVPERGFREVVPKTVRIGAIYYVGPRKEHFLVEEPVRDDR
jgi:hypothetical protein